MFQFNFRSVAVIASMLVVAYIALRVMAFATAWKSDDSSEEQAEPAVVRVAQEESPTVVKPNDDWLEASEPAESATTGSDLPNVSPYLPPPSGPSFRR